MHTCLFVCEPVFVHAGVYVMYMCVDVCSCARVCDCAFVCVHVHACDICKCARVGARACVCVGVYVYVHGFCVSACIGV